MSASVRGFSAQYVPDPFRQEPRNVGVFGVRDDRIVARFYGEVGNGTPDGRKLRMFARPDVFVNGLTTGAACLGAP